MHLLNLKSKYAPSGNKSFGMVSSKINSTHKWVEYSLDINDMQKMLMATKNINEKFQIMELLEIAERKKSWHYKKENFNQYVILLLYSKHRQINCNGRKPNPAPG